METKRMKKKNLDTVLYLRVNNEKKQKYMEVCNYYGMPDLSTFIRELLNREIEIYEKKVGK